VEALIRVWAALLLALLASGCGPWGPQGVFAGGPFAGVDEQAFPKDWSFSDAHPLIAIETRGALFRHSVTILCVAAEGKTNVTVSAAAPPAARAPTASR